MSDLPTAGGDRDRRYGIALRLSRYAGGADCYRHVGRAPQANAVAMEAPTLELGRGLHRIAVRINIHSSLGVHRKRTSFRVNIRTDNSSH